MEFSVIVPAHNEELYIEKTLSSVPKSIELIVVCNGCTDSTELMAKKYAKVIVIEDRNVSKARNLGAKNSSGKNLIFLDADTYFISEKSFDKIEKALKNSIVGTCKSIPDSKSLKAGIVIAFKNLFLWTHWTSGVIFCKRETFEKVQGFNENLTKKEDRDFVNKCLKYGNFGIADCYVVNSMRRYEKYGYLKLPLYWIKESIFRSKKNYPVVR